MEQRKPAHLIVSLLCLTLYCGSHTLRERPRLLSRAVKALPPCPCVSSHLLPSCYSSASHMMLPPGHCTHCASCLVHPAPCSCPPSAQVLAFVQGSALVSFFLVKFLLSPAPTPMQLITPASGLTAPGTQEHFTALVCLSVHLSPRWSPGRTGLCLSESPGE